MMKRIVISLTVMLLTVMAGAQTPAPLYYGLTGLIKNSVGTGFNGTLSIKLSRSTSTNICTSPVSVVAQLPVVFTVTNGAIVNGSTAQFLTNTCLLPNVPYFAELFDTTHNRVYADNWFFPRVTGTTVDVGTLSDMGFGQSTSGTGSTATPIVVAIPSAVVANPAAGQIISQPGATSLSINNLAVTGTFSSTGSIAASITGNAATATALAATPSKCSAGFYSTGISANGTPTCSNSFPTNSSYVTLQVTGGANTYTTQGGYINWNVHTGSPINGEMDFVNAKGAGSGGFSFYSIANNGTPTTPLFIIDQNGITTSSSDVYAGGSAGTGTVHGNTFTGNATTATALAAAPAQCPTYQVAVGIAANGNANCTSSTGLTVRLSDLTTCVPANSTDSQCTGTVTLGFTFADTAYAISTQMRSSAGSSVPNLVLTVTSKLTNSFTYSLSCTFNCSNVSQPYVDVLAWHN